MSDESTEEIATDHELREEFETYLRLRPYLGRLLKLNHDINNSLAGILGNAEFLCEEGESLTSEQRGFAKQILECADRIRDAIKELRQKSMSPETAHDLMSLAKALEIVDPSD